MIIPHNIEKNVYILFHYTEIDDNENNFLFRQNTIDFCRIDKRQWHDDGGKSP